MPAILLVVAALLLVSVVAGTRRTEQQLLDTIARGDAPGSTAAAARSMERLRRAGVIRERDGRLEIDPDRSITYNKQRRQQGILLAVVTASLLISSAVVTKVVLDRSARASSTSAPEPTR